MGHDRLVVVQHHHVGRPPAAARYRRMFVTPALLSFQVRLLRAAGYTFWTLRDAVGMPGRRAVLTFDDGYLDNIVEGAPLLDRLGVPATIFVVSADVGRAQVRWDESGDKLPGDLMGWADLGRLHERGWEVGSHGHEHVHLARRSPEAQSENARLGREAITRHLGVAPSSFAYPYGSFNDLTVSAVRDAGFTCAVTTLRGSHAADFDPYRLRRLPGGGRHAHHYLQALRLLA
jgi:peptidoglycan/xylan/chitin deacetylase (PgdA/CDA1 family)